MGDRLGRGRHEAPIILEDPEKVTLGFALRAWRRSQDLTPTDLAEKAGFGRTGRAYVSKLEHGKIKKPTDLSLRRLTTALGISNETLLTLQLPPNFSIESIPTLHKVEGELIDCFGVLINSKNKSLYHTSDTLYIEEKPTNVDVLFVPINNRGVCMSIDEAVRFTREVRPNLVIPVHYDSPKDSHINPQEFIDKIRGGGIDSRVMNFGEFIYVTNGTSPKRRIE